jgi:hypothetical protein
MEIHRPYPRQVIEIDLGVEIIRRVENYDDQAKRHGAIVYYSHRRRNQVKAFAVLAFIFFISVET